MKALPGPIALMLLTGCGELSGPDRASVPPPASAAYQTMVLDYLTLAIKVKRAQPGVDIELTELGQRAYRAEAPEAAFPADSNHVHVPLAKQPVSWDAYLCPERQITRNANPDSSAWAIIREPSSDFPQGISYLVPSLEEERPQCMKYPSVSSVEGGLKIRTVAYMSATLTIHYR